MSFIPTTTIRPVSPTASAGALCILLLATLAIPGALRAETTRRYNVTLRHQPVAEVFAAAPLPRQKDLAPEAARRQRRTLALQRWRQEVAAQTASFHARLGARRAKDQRLEGLTVVRQHRNIPGLVIEATPSQAALLSTLPGVESVEEEILVKPLLSSSLPYINAPMFQELVGEGEGVSVAVIDSGVHFKGTHFGSCTKAGDEGCAVIVSKDFAGPDGPQPSEHGTWTAGIVHGVAPKAGVIALDVFSYTGAAYPDDYAASDSAINAALDWTIENRDVYAIVAVNMSLGSMSFNQFCGVRGRNSTLVAMQTLYQMDTLTAVASGNDGETEQVSWPACLYPAVAVGACYTSGSRVGYAATFSNQGTIVAFLAPGVNISAGGVSNSSGTSASSPHVAGAMALWAAYLMNADAEGLLSEAVLRNLWASSRPSLNFVKDYDWSWPLLHLDANPPMEERQLVGNMDFLTIGAFDKESFDFSVNNPLATGCDQVIIGIDVASDDSRDIHIELTAPDGTSYSNDLPGSPGGDVRLVMGLIMLPELSSTFRATNPNGQWTLTLTNRNPFTDATVMSLYVAIDTAGDDRLMLRDLTPDPEGSRFDIDALGLALKAFNFARSDISCDFTIRTLRNGVELASEVMQDQTVAPGLATLALYAPLPEDVGDGPLTLRVEPSCKGALPEPAFLETSYDLTLLPVLITDVAANNPVVKADDKTLTVAYTSIHANPWSVACVETLTTSDGEELSRQEVLLEKNTRARTIKADFSSRWNNGATLRATLNLACAPHAVAGDGVTLSFRMLAPPQGQILTDPGVSGAAPFTVSLTASTDGSQDSVKWTFGDGSTSMDLHTTHTYAAVGTYTLLLKLTNAAGSTLLNQTIAVTDRPTETEKKGSKGGCQGAGESTALFAMALAVVLALRYRYRQRQRRSFGTGLQGGSETA